MARARTNFVLSISAATLLFFSSSLAFSTPLSPEPPRSLAALYPAIAPETLAKARSLEGLSASADTAAGLAFVPVGEAGAFLMRTLEGRKYSFLVETLGFIDDAPGPGSRSGGDKLGLYNAMTRFRNLSGVTYRSHSRGEGAVLFDDVTRISDLKKAQALPDEAATSLPERSEYLIRLKDANFGTSYYRVELDTRQPGIFFSMVNAKPLSVFLIPVVGEGGLFSFFYLERTKEGLLVYGVSGGLVAGAAAKQVNLPSAVRKRAAALRGWLVGAGE